MRNGLTHACDAVGDVIGQGEHVHENLGGCWSGVAGEFERQLLRSRTTSRTIYISSQGRVFVRVARRAKGGSDDREIGPDNGGGGNLRLQGDRLVGVMSHLSGASQLTVSFDQAGTSCTANVILGAEGGRAITWKGLNGSIMTATGKPSVSSPTCSISEGNTLAR